MAVLLMFLFMNSSFITDASREARYTVNISRESLREYVDDIGLFARNMPGVVSIEKLDDHTYLYHTRKSIPLASPMETTFHIRKIVESDSVTHYRSITPDAENYMSCTVTITPTGESETSIAIALRIRLVRKNPSEVHWLAPIVGPDFISERMGEDLDGMLKEFIANSNSELYNRYLAATPSRNAPPAQ